MSTLAAQIKSKKADEELDYWIKTGKSIKPVKTLKGELQSPAKKLKFSTNIFISLLFENYSDKKGVPWMEQEEKITVIFNNILSLPESKQEEAFTRTKLFTSLSEEEQIKALAFIQQFAQQAKQIPYIEPLEQLKKDYIKFPENKKITVDSVLAHLKPQLKPYVKAWGAKEDTIFLNDFRKVEDTEIVNKMYNAFYQANMRDNSIPLLSQLISKITKKTDKRIDNFELKPETNYKEYQQIEAIKRYRKNNDQSILEAHHE